MYARRSAARVRLPARLDPLAGAAVHVRGAGGHAKGAVVSVRLGRRSTRGVVADVGVDAPAGRRAGRRRARCSTRIPPTLVDLALWLADYYGSTPARALELVAPRAARAARRAAVARRPRVARRASRSPRRSPTTSGRPSSAIVAALDEGVGEHVLLDGPTGSGKTEVYLQACAAALERGLGTIVLVPEIALAPQTVGRFRQRFGDIVAILHSSLGDAERRDERDRIARGEARIVVGARSAIFAPMRGVGLIVVDEEHDTAYKQESDPRYDARTVAAKRAALEGAVAVYGSATPRPESWSGSGGSSLSARIGASHAAACGSSTSDARRAIRSRRRCSRALGGLVEDGGRAILLLNRRGVAPAVHCRACGVSRRCALCDVALTLHSRRRRSTATTAVARSPSRSSAPPAARSSSHGSAPARSGSRRSSSGACPSSSGSGSTRTSRRGRAPLREALERFRRRTAAVLVGTQIVAKGHHFPGVSLAAVVDADTGLSLPDFRAEERTFQLVTQLAGRSGRDAPGRVLVQTFQPDATPLRHAVNHDVAGFLAGELERREVLGYPPFRHLVSILVAGPEAASAPLAALPRAARAARRASRPTCSGLRPCCGCGGAIARS